MPLNKLHVPEHFSAETCHALNHLLHDSLVETCGAGAEDDFCLISRYAPGDMMLHPTYLGSRCPDSTIIIEIAMLAGRTDDQKEGLYSTIRRRLPDIGLAPADAIILLMENRAIDWSFSEAGSVKSLQGS